MKRSVTLFSFIFLFVLYSVAQKDVIVTIGGNKFSKEEFKQIYQKNNTQLDNESDVKTPAEYIDLFVDYKMKVIEAENKGYDTIASFIKEFAGYRMELAKPYLTDVTVTDSMVKQAYYRTINEVRASHILLRIQPGASSEDSLKVYNRMLEIRNQFTNGEKSFEDLAVEYSEDPSAKRNKGDLGFFKAFNMVTEFENAAYETPVGEVSEPFTTQHGYHMVYVTDTFQNTGEVKAAHIMKIFSSRNSISPEEDSRLKKELDSVYVQLKNGADFEKMVAQYSDDNSTKSKGGFFRWITPTFSIKEFTDAAFALENNGDFSEPIRTPYGWHIIKKLDYRTPKSLEEMKDELTPKVKRDPVRSKHSHDAFINKKKREYNFIAYEKNIQTFKNYFTNIQGDTLPAILPQEILDLELYKIVEKVYHGLDYYKFQIEKEEVNNQKLLKESFLNHFTTYHEKIISDYENSQLDKNYPEFKQIMQEYHDGMLLFAIMEKEVWNKAIEDSIGLQNYYEQNKDQYFWDKQYEGMIIRCSDKATQDSCKALLAAGIEDADSLTQRLEGVSEKKVKIIEGKWEEGRNERIDYFIFGKPKPERAIQEFDFVHGKVIEAGVPKTLEEAKGLYISDYQKVLEDEWMEKLHNKYKVKVNKKTLRKIESL